MTNKELELLTNKKALSQGVFLCSCMDASLVDITDETWEQLTLTIGEWSDWIDDFGEHRSDQEGDRASEETEFTLSKKQSGESRTDR